MGSATQGACRPLYLEETQPFPSRVRYGEDCLLWASVSPSASGLSVPTLQPKACPSALVSPEDQGCIFLGQRHTEGVLEEDGGTCWEVSFKEVELSPEMMSALHVCPGSVATCSLTLSGPQFPCLFYGYDMPGLVPQLQCFSNMVLGPPASETPSTHPWAPS